MIRSYIKSVERERTMKLEDWKQKMSQDPAVKKFREEKKARRRDYSAALKQRREQAVAKFKKAS